MNYSKHSVEQLASEIIRGRRLRKEEDWSSLFECSLSVLCTEAHRIRRRLCGDRIELCSIINAKSGGCSEDCRFCGQSSYRHNPIVNSELLDTSTILADCLYHEKAGVQRYSLVTAGRNLSTLEVSKVCETYRVLEHNTSISLCASHGLLSKEEFQKLKESGVMRYHANLETSQNFFANICTTHTYHDKINCIKNAQSVGLEICSGGIIGLGETMEDRVDMAFDLATLGVESIPINVLIPIQGTLFENNQTLSEDEILRVIAIYRFINPEATIRLGAGRNALHNCGEEAFRSGLNATITGDYLTTSGNNIQKGQQMIQKLYVKGQRKP